MGETMTLDEAIAILSNSAYAGSTTFDDVFKRAEMIGISAMQRIKDMRAHRVYSARPLLPGETEE